MKHLKFPCINKLNKLFSNLFKQKKKKKKKRRGEEERKFF